MAFEYIIIDTKCDLFERCKFPSKSSLFFHDALWQKRFVGPMEFLAVRPQSGHKAEWRGAYPDILIKHSSAAPQQVCPWPCVNI